MAEFEPALAALLGEVRLIERVHQHVTGAIATSLAPAFTAFDFVDTSELGLSRLLAWLLDSGGSHGQGRTYFDKLVAKLDLAWGFDGYASTVTLEETTSAISRSGRRIDLVVRAGRSILAIENKPYTGYGELQISDYLRDVRRKAEGAGSQSWCLVCLQGWNGGIADKQLLDPIVAAESAKGNLLCFNYRQLADWLTDCATETEPIMVQSFLRSMAAFARKGVMREVKMSETGLVDVLLKDAGFLHSSLGVIASGDQVLEAVGRRFVDQITALLPDRMIVANEQSSEALSLHKGNTGFDIVFGSELPFKIRVMFERVRFDGPYVSVRQNDPSADTNPALQQALNAHGYALRTDRYGIGWQWLHKLSQTLQREPEMVEVWRMMADGRLASELVTIAQRIEGDLATIQRDSV